MKIEDNIEQGIEDGFEENESKISQDARQVYYKLWALIKVHVQKYYVQNDMLGYRRAVDSMFNHVYPMFTIDERKEIDKLIASARNIEREVIHANIPTPAHALIQHNKTLEYETYLRDAERLIYIYMDKNRMLLPRSAGDSGLFNEAEFMRDSDL